MVEAFGADSLKILHLCNFVRVQISVFVCGNQANSSITLVRVAAAFLLDAPIVQNVSLSDLFFPC